MTDRTTLPAPRAPIRRPVLAVLRRTLAAAAAALVGWSGAALADPKTVCTVTINSPDEKDTFERHLPKGDYRFVELVQKGRPDWLASACRSEVRCDALIISGHFDDGTEFYTDRFDNREFLTVHQLQQASCSASCDNVFAQLKEVYLFGCNTLRADPRNVAGDEIRRALQRAGQAPGDAERIAAALDRRYGESNRDRLRQVFRGVPVLYGFSSKAPLGHRAGPMLERYFRSAPAGEVAGGRASAALLNLFAPTSMIAVAGLADGDPDAGLRKDICGFADEAPSHGRKLAFLHEVLRRDMTEVRMFLDHLERYAATLGPAQRALPEVAGGLAAIAADRGTRERYLAFARDADEAPVHTRMMALARSLGWLNAEEERAEFVRMIAQRMARDRVAMHEVDLVCATRRDGDGTLATQLQATGAARVDSVAHAAVLACLGSGEGHARTVRALTSSDHADAAIAQTYLRHRPLAGVGELRTVASGIGRLKEPALQVRALETLAKQRLADAQSLHEIAGLFPQARSLDVQRAIAGILIRSDHALLSRAELARTLRQHRLKSPDGSDVIDVLIRLLS